ncbi:toxin glutamine deamidase domain-containing protein, partial [Micromonospora sonneratiae]
NHNNRIIYLDGQTGQTSQHPHHHLTNIGHITTLHLDPTGKPVTDATSREQELVYAGTEANPSTAGDPGRNVLHRHSAVTDGHRLTEQDRASLHRAVDRQQAGESIQEWIDRAGLRHGYPGAEDRRRLVEAALRQHAAAELDSASRQPATSVEDRALITVVDALRTAATADQPLRIDFNGFKRNADSGEWTPEYEVSFVESPDDRERMERTPWLLRLLPMQADGAVPDDFAVVLEPYPNSFNLRYWPGTPVESLARSASHAVAAMIEFRQHLVLPAPGRRQLWWDGAKGAAIRLLPAGLPLPPGVKEVVARAAESAAANSTASTIDAPSKIRREAKAKRWRSDFDEQISLRDRPTIYDAQQALDDVGARVEESTGRKGNVPKLVDNAPVRTTPSPATPAESNPGATSLDPGATSPDPGTAGPDPGVTGPDPGAVGSPPAVTAAGHSTNSGAGTVTTNPTVDPDDLAAVLRTDLDQAIHGVATLDQRPIRSIEGAHRHANEDFDARYELAGRTGSSQPTAVEVHVRFVDVATPAGAQGRPWVFDTSLISPGHVRLRVNARQLLRPGPSNSAGGNDPAEHRRLRLRTALIVAARSPGPAVRRMFFDEPARQLFRSEMDETVLDVQHGEFPWAATKLDGTHDHRGETFDNAYRIEGRNGLSRWQTTVHVEFVPDFDNDPKVSAERLPLGRGHIRLRVDPNKLNRPGRPAPEEPPQRPAPPPAGASRKELAQYRSAQRRYHRDLNVHIARLRKQGVAIPDSAADWATAAAQEYQERYERFQKDLADFTTDLQRTGLEEPPPPADNADEAARTAYREALENYQREVREKYDEAIESYQQNVRKAIAQAVDPLVKATRKASPLLKQGAPVGQSLSTRGVRIGEKASRNFDPGNVAGGIQAGLEAGAASAATSAPNMAAELADQGRKLIGQGLDRATQEAQAAGSMAEAKFLRDRVLGPRGWRIEVGQDDKVAKSQRELAELISRSADQSRTDHARQPGDDVPAQRVESRDDRTQEAVEILEVLGGRPTKPLVLAETVEWQGKTRLEPFDRSPLVEKLTRLSAGSTPVNGTDERAEFDGLGEADRTKRLGELADLAALTSFEALPEADQATALGDKPDAVLDFTKKKLADKIKAIRDTEVVQGLVPFEQLSADQQDDLLVSAKTYRDLLVFEDLDSNEKLDVLDAMDLAQRLDLVRQQPIADKLNFVQGLGTFRAVSVAEKLSDDKRAAIVADPQLIRTLKSFEQLTDYRKAQLLTVLETLSTTPDPRAVLAQHDAFLEEEVGAPVTTGPPSRLERLKRRLTQQPQKRDKTEVPSRIFKIAGRRIEIGVLADYSTALRTGTSVPLSPNTFLIRFSGEALPAEVEQIVTREFDRIRDLVTIQREALGPRAVNAFVKNVPSSLHIAVRGALAQASPLQIGAALALGAFAPASAYMARWFSERQAGRRSTADLKMAIPEEKSRADLERFLTDAVDSVDAEADAVRRRLGEILADPASTDEQRKFAQQALDGLSYPHREMSTWLAEVVPGLETPGFKGIRISENTYAYAPLDADGKPVRDADPVVVVFNHSRIDEIRAVRLESDSPGDLSVIVPNQVSIGDAEATQSRDELVRQLTERLNDELAIFRDRPSGRLGLKAFLRESAVNNGVAGTVQGGYGIGGGLALAQYAAEGSVYRMLLAGWSDHAVSNINGARAYQAGQLWSRYSKPNLQDLVQAAERINELAGYHDHLNRVFDRAEEIRTGQLDPGHDGELATPDPARKPHLVRRPDPDGVRALAQSQVEPLATGLTPMFTKVSFDNRSETLALTPTDTGSSPGTGTGTGTSTGTGTGTGTTFRVRIDSRVLPSGQDSTIELRPNELNWHPDRPRTHRIVLAAHLSRGTNGLPVQRALARALGTLYAHETGSTAEHHRIAEGVVLARADLDGNPAATRDLGRWIDDSRYRSGLPDAEQRWAADSALLPDDVRQHVDTVRQQGSSDRRIRDEIAATPQVSTDHLLAGLVDSREGFSPASQLDHDRLLAALPHNQHGQPTPHPDPLTTPWITLQNDGGHQQPGRNTNCVETTRALIATWYGHPTVAAAQQPHHQGEKPTILHTWLGAPLQPTGTGPTTLDTIAQQLTNTGHGSATIIGHTWTDPTTPAHMLLAVNHNNRIIYLDGQTGQTSQHPHHHLTNIGHITTLHLDPTGKPVTDPPNSTPTTDDHTYYGDSDLQSGARMRPRDYERAMAWAAEAYDRFRRSDVDIDDIARNLADVERPNGRRGFTAEEIGQVKRHLMMTEHLLDDYDGGLVRRRFDPDPDIAEAWIRLREGRPLDTDRILLEHELAELGHQQANPGATYRDSHVHANSLHNWEAVVPGRTGEDLDVSWGSERTDGNTDRLSEGPGRQSGGRVHVRVSPGDGPAVGDHQGLADGASDGWAGGRPVRAGALEDHAVPRQQGELAGGGKLRGVADALDLAARHEPGISRAVDEAAAAGGGSRREQVRPHEDPEAVRRRVVDEAAESRPGRPGSEVGVRGRLRYSVEFPSVGYADGVRRMVEGLVARGYQPVRLVDGWAAGDVGGLVSQWRDPGTGQEFRVR